MNFYGSLYVFKFKMLSINFRDITITQRIKMPVQVLK